MRGAATPDLVLVHKCLVDFPHSFLQPMKSQTRRGTAEYICLKKGGVDNPTPPTPLQVGISTKMVLLPRPEPVLSLPRRRVFRNVVHSIAGFLTTISPAQVLTYCPRVWGVIDRQHHSWKVPIIFKSSLLILVAIPHHSCRKTFLFPTSPRVYRILGLRELRVNHNVSFAVPLLSSVRSSSFLSAILSQVSQRSRLRSAGDD